MPIIKKRYICIRENHANCNQSEYTHAYMGLGAIALALSRKSVGSIVNYTGDVIHSDTNDRRNMSGVRVWGDHGLIFSRPGRAVHSSIQSYVNHALFVQQSMHAYFTYFFTTDLVTRI